MDENDITVNADDQAASQVEQPAADAPVETPVETTNTEPSEPSQDAETVEEQPSTPVVDDKLQQFAKSQGLDLDSPSAIKAAAAAMKFRSEATRNYQKANELEKATNITNEQLPADITPQEQENVRLRNLELKYEIQSWKMQNQDKLALEGDMVKILSDPNMRTMVQQGALSLDHVYKLAKADAPDNSAEVKSQAKQEALRSLAHKQQAAVPTGHATTASTPKEKPFAELTLQEMEAKLGFARR